MKTMEQPAPAAASQQEEHRAQGVEKKPPAFCRQSTCSSCALDGKTTCRQGCGEVLDFMIPALVFFIPFAGGLIIERAWIWLAVWVALAVPYFIYFQALLVCCRCPHYNTDKPFLTCHAAFGLPKIPRYNPTPLTRAGRLFFYAYLTLVILYPFPFFVVAGQWFLLVIAACALFSWVWFVSRRLCVQCINLFCPFNRLPESPRQKWNELNPVEPNPRRQ